MERRDSSFSRSSFSYFSFLTPYLLTFLGFALRLYHIAYQSIWWDEANAVHVAQGGLTAVLRTPSDVSWTHPPLHYGLLTGWTRLAGFSELSIRYPSLIFGVLLLPLTYLVARRLFDRPTALVAMIVAALSPLYVTYGQEARVYAILPLLYLWLLHIFHRLIGIEVNSPAPLRLWLELSVVEALILYSHFVLAFGLLYVNLLLMVIWLRRRWPWPHVRAWIGSQVLAVALFIPWLWNLARHWENILPWIGVGGGETGPSLPAFFSRIWRFTVSGNEASVAGYRLLEVGVALLGVTSILALLLLFATDDKRRQTGVMLAHGLVPLVFCFVFWQIWPLSHPRYTIGFSIPFFIVIARSLVVLWTRRTAWHRLVSVLFVGVLAQSLGSGLYVQYFVEAFHKDDARGVAAYLETMTTAADVVLIGPDDYSVPYYYDGPATVVMAHDEPRAGKVRHLSEITSGMNRLFLVRWEPSKADLHGLRPFLLEQAGRLVAWRDFRGLDVRTYVLGGPTGSLPEVNTFPPARFGPLLLTGVFYEPTATTDNAVAVALRWRLVEPTDEPYKAVVMLTDAEGQRLSSADVLLLDEVGRQTHRWPAGAEMTNFYVVPVPVGTPPLLHHLAVGVYDADTLARLPLAGVDGQLSGEQDVALGAVTLAPGRYFDDDPYGTWAGVDWETPQETSPQIAEGLLLERFAVWPRSALPGEQVTVLLRWRAEGAARPSTAPQLHLSQGAQMWSEVGSQLLSAAYPPDRWPAGLVVVERRALAYPPRRGPADLTLAANDRRVSLGQVRLDESALLWEPPPMAQSAGVRIGDFAELLGYDLEPTRLVAGQSFQLTLYWRALNDAPLEIPYTVFTQLLAADGHLIAQHDGPPAGNERPTTTWVGGEIIVDEHTLAFGDPAYTGPATLILGLYDSATVTRVNTVQGQGYIVLPEGIVVSER
ncbi:MAG: glycosyltransferase family 39 protein [Chloroflexota bacterium]|nr:glycosyltransferase family 39 protein [Chloroflexota bacterium]